MQVKQFLSIVFLFFIVIFCVQGQQQSTTPAEYQACVYQASDEIKSDR